MYKFDIEKLKKHPFGFAIAIALASALTAGSIVSGFWYVLVVTDLRDRKIELITELQVAKQRVSSLEATQATYDGQCIIKMQAQGKESQERCDKQLSAIMDSSKLQASNYEKLLDAVQRKDKVQTETVERSNNQQVVLTELRQRKASEKILIDRINLLHVKHKNTSREYGYKSGECSKKENNFFDNICEHAAMNKAELESIEREIESAKLQLSQAQQQILQLQSSIK